MPCFIFSDSDVTQQVNLDIDSRRYRTVGRSKLVVPFGNESSCRTGIPVSIPVGLSACFQVHGFRSWLSFRHALLIVNIAFYVG